MCQIVQSSNQPNHQLNSSLFQSFERSFKRSPKKHLVFLMGIPGSGKSTWVDSLIQALNYQQVSIISPDLLRQKLFGATEIQGSWHRIWQQAIRETRTALGLGKLVIYDATNTRCRHRRQTLACFRALGFRQITGIWLDLPLEICLRRNQQRDRQVPETVIRKMHQDLQLTPPSLADGLNCLQRYILIEGKSMVQRY